MYFLLKEGDTCEDYLLQLVLSMIPRGNKRVYHFLLINLLHLTFQKGKRRVDTRGDENCKITILLHCSKTKKAMNDDTMFWFVKNDRHDAKTPTFYFHYYRNTWKNNELGTPCT